MCQTNSNKNLILKLNAISCMYNNKSFYYVAIELFLYFFTNLLLIIRSEMQDINTSMEQLYNMHANFSSI